MYDLGIEEERMNEQLGVGDEIYSHFATNHIKLQREWFKDVLNYLQTLTVALLIRIINIFFLRTTKCK